MGPRLLAGLAALFVFAPGPDRLGGSKALAGEIETQIPDDARYVKASVVHSLEETFVRATDKQLGPALAQVVKRVLVWWINPRRDLRRDDVIEVVYEARDDAEPVVYAVWMRSQKRRRTLSAVRYKADDARFFRYYRPDGYEIEKRLRRSPVRNYEQITSLLGDGRRHQGIDFKAPIGTPVRAPFNGVVRRRNWSTRRNGLCLELSDPRTGRRALMLHLNSIYRRIRPGVRVKAGQKIATLGNTGRSSAPHLHYQLQRANGRILNPLRVHRTWRKRLKPEQAKKMRQVLARFAQMRTGST
ncbi:MAG: M23 family metallopeptidase [Myxococcota bacterium]